VVGGWQRDKTGRKGQGKEEGRKGEGEGDLVGDAADDDDLDPKEGHEGGVVEGAFEGRRAQQVPGEVKDHHSSAAEGGREGGREGKGRIESPKWTVTPVPSPYP